MCRHQRWLTLATKKAEEHVSTTYRHAAVLVRGGSVLAIGVNHSKRGIIFDEIFGTKGWHAEIDVLSRFDPDDVKDTTLYVAGISPGDNVMNSKPCPLCQQVIERFAIKACFYSDRGELKRL